VQGKQNKVLKYVKFEVLMVKVIICVQMLSDVKFTEFTEENVSSTSNILHFYEAKSMNFV
jgi:hypothetical protein